MKFIRTYEDETTTEIWSFDIDKFRNGPISVEIKYKKKLLPIRPKPKIILIKPKKCYPPFDKDDKPERKRKIIDEKIEI